MNHSLSHLYTKVEFSVHLGLIHHKWCTVNLLCCGQTFLTVQEMKSLWIKNNNEGKEKIIRLTVHVSRIAQPRTLRFHSKLTHLIPRFGVCRHIRELNSHFSEWRSTQQKSATTRTRANGWPD